LSKKEKQLQAIRNNPTNVRFDVLRSILLDYDFIETKPGSGSSHYTYHRGVFRITIPKKHPINAIYVKRVTQIIDKLEAEE